MTTHVPGDTLAAAAIAGPAGVTFASMVAAADLAAKAVTPAKNFVVKKHHEHKITVIWREILADTEVPVSGRRRGGDARTRVAKDIVAMLNDPHQLLSSDAVRGLQVQAALKVLNSPDPPGSPASIRIDDVSSSADWDKLGTRLVAAIESAHAKDGVVDRYLEALSQLEIRQPEPDALTSNPPPAPQQRLGDLLALLAYARIIGEKQRDWQELFRWWQKRDRRGRSSTHIHSRIAAHDGDASGNGKATHLLAFEVQIWGHHTALKFLQAADGRRELGEFRAALETDTAEWLARELDLRRQAALTDMAESARRFVRLVAIAIAVVVVAAGLDAADLVEVTHTVEQVWSRITD